MDGHWLVVVAFLVLVLPRLFSALWWNGGSSSLPPKEVEKASSSQTVYDDDTFASDEGQKRNDDPPASSKEVVVAQPEDDITPSVSIQSSKSTRTTTIPETQDASQRIAALQQELLQTKNSPNFNVFIPNSSNSSSEDNRPTQWRCVCETGFLPRGMLQSLGGAEAVLRMGAGQCFHKKSV